MRAALAVLAALVSSSAAAQTPYEEEILWSEETALEEDVSAEALPEHTAEQVEQAATLPTSGTPIALPGGENKSAVTPQAISLPSAEGSIEGMGESFSPVLSSGTGTFSVPIALPPGRAGVQPSLALSYSTSGGNGIAGIGWDVGVPFISRQTDRGLPRYVDRAVWHAEEDRFVYNGGQELVPVDSTAIAAIDSYNPGGAAYGAGAVPTGAGVTTAWQQYRARVEGGFMRFFRSPDSRRWVVQSKDGTLFEFGAITGGVPTGFDSSASLQTESDAGTGPVYKWLLTRMSDAHGSTVYYTYLVDAGERYLSDVYYISPASCGVLGNPDSTRTCTQSLANYGARVHFDYELRDDVASSYVPGWRVETGYRLERIIATRSEGTVGTRSFVRRYHLTYDSTSHHSLLSEVMVEGRPDALDSTRQVYVASTSMSEGTALGPVIVGRTLPPMRFTYSATPSGPIAGHGGVSSTMLTAGSSPPHSVDESRTDFFDVNSDGLPDILVTDPARYRTPSGAPAVGVFFNGFTGTTATPSTAGTFSAAVPVAIASGMSGTLDLSNLNVVPMDIDGDGRSDLLHMPRVASYGFFSPTRAADAAIAEVSPSRQNWRFSYAAVNLPRGTIDPRIDFGRDGAFIRTFDVNNDHLVDVVRTTGTTMQTWLNLGWLPGGEGRFGSAAYGATTGWTLSVDPIESCLLHDGLPLDFSDPEVNLADMNGDGIQDIVKLRSGRVIWWPGRGTGVWGDGSRDCPADTFASGRHREMANPPRSPAIFVPEEVYLTDVNEDGTADLVLVAFDRFSVWFNEEGERFTNRLITRTPPLAPSFAPRTRFVDIDGSGTLDLVYGHASEYRYVDFMDGVVPRLLTHVENGLGATTDLEYESSATDYLRDLAAASSCTTSSCTRFTWSHSSVTGGCDPAFRESTLDTQCHFSGGSPVVSTVVRAMETSDHFDRLGREENVVRTEYAYHDGYYEGIEQEFRGFGAADAIAVGDAVHPTSTTRTFFNQGRRASAIARVRLADNPTEPLKARAYLTESFDDAGRYLSSVHSGYAVRTLLSGLDGRAIRYAFVLETNELRYDVTDWVAGSGALSGLTAVQWQTVGATGTMTVAATDTATLAIRGTGYAHLKSAVESVDNVGTLLQSRAYGRVRGEYGEVAGTTIAHEQIVSSSRASLVNAAAWIWRTSESFVEGSGWSGPQLGVTHNEYNAQGDLTRSYTDANLWTGMGAPPVPLFAGDATAAGYTLTNQTLDGSSSYDEWGNATTACGGASTPSFASCLRYATVSFDTAYEAFPITESVATHEGMGGAAVTLSTSASWDYGYGLLLSATDPNAQTTNVGYDGLGRLTYIEPPDSDEEPTHRFQYELVPSGLPVSIVHAYQENSTTIGASTISSRSYVDGLGRTRASLVKNGSTWEQSGVVTFTARGTAEEAWQTHLLSSSSPAPSLAVSIPNWLTHGGSVGCKAASLYDPFGRTVSVTECADDPVNAVSTITDYHALSTVVKDPLDLVSGPFQNTPAITRTDGHGRVIDQVLQNKRYDHAMGTHGAVEYYRLFTTYRPDGAVMSIRRAQTTSEAWNASLSGTPARELTRTFNYDSAGRRISSTDPDTDNTAAADGAKTWRYLFNTVGDLVAVRDPRGCGQNFYYDRAGRLTGEDYVTCSESQPQGDTPVDSVPIGSVAEGKLTAARDVDVRHYFDADPPWVSSFSGASPARPSSPPLAGRMTATSDRAQRTLLAYDERGRATWTARAVAVVPGDTFNTGFLTQPPFVRTETVTPVTRTYDTSAGHVYVTSATFDHGDRPATMALPSDPDYAGGGTTPILGGGITYDARGLPNHIDLRIDVGGTVTTRPIVDTIDYTRDRLPLTIKYDHQASGVANSEMNFTYDARRRPATHIFTRQANTGAATGHIDRVGTVFDRSYTWDLASNLTEVADNVSPTEFPAGYRPTRTQVTYDGLYRVVRASINYKQTSGSWTSTDTATDWRTNRETHRTVDPMRERAPQMLPTLTTNRVSQLDYDYDWLANMTKLDDGAATNFYERAIGRVTNGDLTTGLRPSALYVSSTLPTAPQTYNASTDRGGFQWTEYGVSGNAEMMTVMVRCRDISATNRCYDDTTLTSASARRAHIDANCTCQRQQHYQYRYDEVNRITEARRYERSGGGNWSFRVRQRYRYDAANDRIIKISIEQNPDSGDPADRVHLYVYPGDFDRSGLRLSGGTYNTDATLGTETQYLIGGARVVWKQDPGGSTALARNVRATYAIGDLIQSTSAVIDLWSGELLETRTYYPNGAQETMRSQGAGMGDVTMQPEVNGFTTKEADDEVGITYFGQRYLFQHLGRWTTPDPLHVHAVGGGEALNSYHYVSGNLLQGRDPVGLCEDGEFCIEVALRNFLRAHLETEATQNLPSTQVMSVLSLTTPAQMYNAATAGERIGEAIRQENPRAALRAAMDLLPVNIAGPTVDAIERAREGGPEASAQSGSSGYQALRTTTDSLGVLAGASSGGARPRVGGTPVLPRLPAGVAEAQHVAARPILARLEAAIGGEARYQGSRVTGTHTPTSDLDIMIRVSPERFDALIQEAFGTPNPGTANARTMQRALEDGRILGGRGGHGIRAARAELQEVFGMDVDVSIVREGGRFDNNSVPTQPPATEGE